ncbi:DNA uptake protein ComE [Chitinophaga sp. CF118]|uniref:ComEA family DNA-binding protein n=1 Tax=Chitinophaga sp. CF118 TaxID=1884367 RepID=UPI0008F359E6|nr:helix-hairpin-helix domain-containing protein [Chitinophaga sp. CF118]SFE32698.1 DNA uptake protein ComE [Chitinophaga sp. CF118]
MKQTFWKTYFSFSRQERLGITTLLVLISICVSIPAAWEYYYPPVIADDDTLAQAWMPLQTTDVVKTAPATKGILFSFDPNRLSEQGWIKLGVAPRNIQTILHYRAKGGVFRKKEDLLRIYGFPSDMFAKLAPYIQITVPERDSLSRSEYRTQAIKWERERVVTKARVIDINEADSAVWESLNGIGPVLAGRIIRFRDKLGGFYDISQVRETYGLPDSTFVKIQASLQLNKVSLKFLDINHLDERSLAQHPYIHYKLARLIVLYRNSNGPFKQADELLAIPLVDDKIYRKLEPYIKTIN